METQGKQKVSLKKKEVKMNNLNTNTFNFGKTGIEIGTTLRFIEWTGSEDSRPRLEVASKLTATPLFGDKTKSVRLNEASRLAFKLETGTNLTDYMSMDMWETEDGTVLRTFVEDLEESNGFTKKSKKSLASPWTDNVHYETVYSHLKSADEVVRSDISEAIGYDPKASAFWNSYLDGGDGALENKNLTDILFKHGFVSDCCSAPSFKVAGYILCKQCKGEFVSSVLEETS
jgi:hypothetical protein